MKMTRLELILPLFLVIGTMRWNDIDMGKRDCAGIVLKINFRGIFYIFYIARVSVIFTLAMSTYKIKMKCGFWIAIYEHHSGCKIVSMHCWLYAYIQKLIWRDESLLYRTYDRYMRSPGMFLVHWCYTTNIPRILCMDHAVLYYAVVC